MTSLNSDGSSSQSSSDSNSSSSSDTDSGSDSDTLPSNLPLTPSDLSITLRTLTLLNRFEDIDQLNSHSSIRQIVDVATQLVESHSSHSSHRRGIDSSRFVASSRPQRPRQRQRRKQFQKRENRRNMRRRRRMRDREIMRQTGMMRRKEKEKTWVRGQLSRREKKRRGKRRKKRRRELLKLAEPDDSPTPTVVDIVGEEEFVLRRRSESSDDDEEIGETEDGLESVVSGESSRPQVVQSPVGLLGLVDSGRSEFDQFLDTDLKKPKKCYICMSRFTRVHFFYHRLCPQCALFNYERRFQLGDLQDRICIVTGGRVKIGFEISLKLLRSGASVVATTRFPKDAAIRFAQVPDFLRWRDQLDVYGPLDLRVMRQIRDFSEYVSSTYGRIDILIHNAAQTISRPPIFHSNLLSIEKQDLSDLSENAQQVLRKSAQFTHLGLAPPLLMLDYEESQRQSTEFVLENATEVDVSQSLSLPVIRAPSSEVLMLFGDPSENDPEFFPSSIHDINDQQVDNRERNSWRKSFEEIPMFEFVECQLVNCLSPYYLTKRLLPLLKEPSSRKKEKKFIINVSAAEGVFHRNKNSFHPQSNIAKAGLNMFTRTSASEFIKMGIRMNSVDTGWVTDEIPRAFRRGFTVPLDELDGASRVLDPIFTQLKSGERIFGRLFKDYKVIPW